MIDKKYISIIFALFMSLFMSFFMSFVITVINLGLVEGFFWLWITAFYKTFFIAFPTVLVVVPQVRKLTTIMIKQKE